MLRFFRDNFEDGMLKYIKFINFEIQAHLLHIGAVKSKSGSVEKSAQTFSFQLLETH